MAALGEAAALHVGDVFAERCDALALEAAVFFEEVAVGLGVARQALFVVAEDVVGEEELRVATAAAPNSFLSCATPHGMATPEEAIRVGFRALELGASSVYCSASPLIIEVMAREGIPVVGHLGLVPRHVTWTGYRAIGKTVDEARELYRRMKELENAGAYAAELEVVPHNLARWLSSQTKLLLMSLGSGPGCDTQFLFSDDILGDYEERPPRHAKAYRDFSAEHRRLQQERIAAFGEYIADVKAGRFPERSHLVEMETQLLDEVMRSIPAR